MRNMTHNMIWFFPMLSGTSTWNQKWRSWIYMYGIRGDWFRILNPLVLHGFFLLAFERCSVVIRIFTPLCSLKPKACVACFCLFNADKGEWWFLQTLDCLLTICASGTSEPKTVSLLNGPQWVFLPLICRLPFRSPISFWQPRPVVQSLAAHYADYKELFPEI